MSGTIIPARVERIAPLTDSIIQLNLIPDRYVDYIAGQYLNIMIDEQALSYSIANAPLGSHQYELHIRHSRDNPYNQDLFAHIKQQGTVSLSLPFGDCHIERLDLARPILFIAAGTGFAPVKAMIEQLLASDDERAFDLFWGARTQSDLYLDEQVKNWEKHVARFNYASFISEESKDTLITTLLAQPHLDLHLYQIVISGPFDMVYKIRDSLVSLGISTTQLHSDAFSFE
jgi:CDP-4-dehydro-6-deoxyglucose reductase